MTDSILAHLRAHAESAPRSMRDSYERARAWTAQHRRALEGRTRWRCSGIGASDGSARACAQWLDDAPGVSARFRPFSAWLDAGDDCDGVIVFSQGLCPNAKIAIDRAPASATRVLVTAAHEHPIVRDAVARGWLLCEHAPRDEGPLLVRLEGPLCALAVARAIAQRARGDDTVAQHSEAFVRGVRAGARVAGELTIEQLDGVRAMIGSGAMIETHAGLPWTWMESTLTAPIALFDALSFAHGPLQALYEQRATIVAFERAAQPAWIDRVAQVLAPERHTLVRLASEAPSDHDALFEHAGALWSLLFSLLEHRPRELRAWPGKGCDGPLYELDRAP